TPKSKRFACKICAKIFPSNFILMSHLRSHTGEHPYECGHCTFTFVTKGQLNKHLKSCLGNYAAEANNSKST
ncbi:hypothetical protein PFISCL1PPCAC_7018, partial [Pristionchus fissidentatus]